MSRLRTDVERTVTGHGGLLLITGEAGIGKTTLLGATIDHARDLGATVAVGTCATSPATPPFYPWVQILRALQRAVGTEIFASYLTEAGLDLADPLRMESADSAEPVASREQREFALFDALAAAFAALSHRSPLVIALEDLHWADRLSVDLLDFLARHVWFEQILIVATYRDTEVDGSTDPVHRRVAGLNPSQGTLQVSGLDVDAVAALVHRVSGRIPPPSFVADLHRRTAGNPFFVEQTARLWATGQGDDVIPQGVVDAVRRRLDSLSFSTVTLLQTAALLSVPAPFPLLAAITRAVDSHAASEPQADPESSALAGALSARLLRATPGGRYEFVHDLVRETLLTDLDPDHAQALHAAIVEASAAHPDVISAGQAADHAVRAGSLVSADTAVDLLVAAGRAANAQIDGVSAIAAYARAAELTTDPDRRTLIRLDQGAEMLFTAVWNKEPTEESLTLLGEVIAEAGRADGDPVVAARVSLELSRFEAIDPDQVGVLMRHAGERLLPEVPRGRRALAAALTSHLTEMAREDEDDDTLSSMLTTQHEALWRPGTATERLQIMTELQVIARRRGDRDTEQFAASMMWVCLLELNDPEYLSQYQAFAALAARYRTPRLAAGADLDGAVLAAFQGRFDEAFERYATVVDTVPAKDLYFWMVHYLEWTLHLRRGDWPRAQEITTRFVESELDYRLIVATQAAEEGRFAEAATYLRERAGRVAVMNQALYDRVLALTAAGTGDPGLIASARTTLAPVSGTWSVDLYGMDVGGPIDLYLGMVELAAGDRDRAVALFDRAIRAADHLSSTYWATAARIELLRALSATDPRRRDVQDRVTTDLSGLDVPVLHERALSLSSVDTRRAEPATSLSSGNGAQFRRDGAVWQLSWAGHTVAVPDAKGLADLHTLLGNPGVDIASTTLLDPGGLVPAVVAAARAGADPVLDDTAREQYRVRLQRLDDLLDEAGAAGDTKRRDELLTERQALITELRAATGLGGRSRRLGDPAERARKTVSARIRDTLRKLDAAHPPLADHLRHAVCTGSSCRYEPKEPVRWLLS